MSKQSLEQLIIGIQRRDNKTLAEIYKQYFPLVAHYVTRNGGTNSDAKDVFQEAIVIVYKLVQANELKIKSDFGPYLTGIAKRIWMNQLRRESIHERFVQQSDTELIEDHPSDAVIEGETELALIRKHILNLGEECQKVLLMSSEGITNEKIADTLGYKSEKIVRTKKYKCKDLLIKLIKSDPKFKLPDL
ncbi:MAG: sigma-70 family RNA polymerase sigma factor [Bacteroidales bacterium]|nr:sigma-70 family RNA polymerase sigma factor [Bacteroidales bacterium]